MEKMVSLHADCRLIFSNSLDFNFVCFFFVFGLVNPGKFPPTYFHYSLRKRGADEICEAMCPRCFLSFNMVPSFPWPLLV